MSLPVIDRLRSRTTARGQHRIPTVRELQNRITTLQASRYELKNLVGRLAHDRQQLERQLDAAGIELSGLRLDLEEAQQELTELRAALANATSVTAPAAVRNIDPGDLPTSPTGINVRPLWDALGIVPGNTSPSHAPGRRS
ncbi:hypothetical protein [Streptomyces sp. WM6349]|uniref:hypothetical protein n=1 Tax=Streptomyces sp. WM6349 TaxID=1415552 RepID=UPI0006AED13D|nr:hypothetical protein [Streptomyces sp. WM6349]KOU17057.1 hypothetical protein ADK49_17140 [Streptomyces sp. WM6349]